ncbi:unnamed protein product [Bursaphelenchus xylophilus]|uniref:Ribosome biogenesis protein NOP53 n=1 Tax=Bursaphelenchus xylophilus TaxID=6326 RepID=A0A1I7S6K1_BURXY|nr:unnamed protein product [Bursaphelenchus xylophilus]CAG9120510.1 unnamed protein product [Bursaphelenchus xylophilus]
MVKTRRTIVKKNADAFDLWEKDFTPKEAKKHTEGVNHYLKETRKINHVRKTKYVPSILPAVSAPFAGASYNPSVDNYMEYARKIANEENLEIKNEKWVKNKLKLRNGDSVATVREQIKEEEGGFLSNSDDELTDVEIKEELDDEEKPEVVKKPKNKPKSTKQRKKELERRQEELERLEGKRTKQNEAELLRIKSLIKELKEKLKQHQEDLVERRRKRVLNRLTAKKQLGHGKFEDFKEPVLLPEELNGSLRGLKSTGTSILSERLRSMEKRNLLACKSDKKPKELKHSLKFKVTNKRETTEFLEAEMAKLPKVQPSKHKNKKRRRNQEKKEE